MNMLTFKPQVAFGGKYIWFYFLPAWLLCLVSLRICLPHQVDHIVLTFLASAGACFLWFVGLHSRLFPSRSTPEQLVNSSTDRPSASPALVAGIPCAALLILALVFFGGVRHDYKLYTSQWSYINAGNIPWVLEAKNNYYFPLHSFLAPLAAVHPLLVKILFAGTALFTFAISAFGHVVDNERTGSQEKFILFISSVFCPYAIFVFFWLGLNDAVTSSLLLLATILATAKPFQPRFQFLAGVLLALGACIKVYPIVVAPFFFVRQRKFQWPFLAGCLVALLAVFGLSFHMWGSATFYPFMFASSREGTFISPFNALRHAGLNLDRFSTVAMASALAASFSWYVRRNIDFPSAVLVGLGMTLFFYSGGNINYLAYVIYATPFMIRYWSANFNRETASKLSLALLGWGAFLNWYQLQLVLNCGMTLDTTSRVFRNHGGWINAIVILLAFSTFRTCLMKPDRHANPPTPSRL
jgi:hypothetical protein